MDDLEKRLERVEGALLRLNGEIGYLKGKVDQETALVKWVIFPLLFIVAALVGIKLLIP